MQGTIAEVVALGTTAEAVASAVVASLAIAWAAIAS